MPARLIRDDMLESERVQTLPADARWLFVAVMLTADDVGLLELSTFKLHRKAGLDVRVVEKLLPLLVDADLLRSYQVDGKTFGFIPRFGQRLQIKRAKCPLPPDSLLSDDEDAIRKIKHLRSDPTVNYGDAPVTHGKTPPEPEPEPEPVVASTEAVGRSAPSASSLPPPTPPDFRGDANAGAIKPAALVLLAQTWELPEAWGMDAEALGWKPAEVIREAERFRQYWTAGKGAGKRRSVRGWRQSWSNWLGKAERDRR